MEMFLSGSSAFKVVMVVMEKIGLSDGIKSPL